MVRIPLWGRGWFSVILCLGPMLLSNCAGRPDATATVTPPAALLASPTSPPATLTAAPPQPEPPAQAAATAIRFFELVDTGGCEEAYRLSLQVRWKDAGINAFQSDGLLSEAEFCSFLNSVAGINGSEFDLSSVGVDSVRWLPPDRRVPEQYPELFALAALPADLQPVNIYEIEVGGSFATYDNSSTRAWNQHMLVAQLPQSNWRLLLPGRPPNYLPLQSGAYLMDQGLFEGAVLLGQ